MIGALTVVTAPADLPVTVADARVHCRVDGTDEDAYLQGLIGAATTYIETITGRSLVTRTHDWKRPGFPDAAEGYEFRVPRPPLASVTSITYVDTAGATQTLATSVYEAVDTAGDITAGRIVLKPSQSWPDTQSDKAITVTVRFVAGYGGPEAVAAPLRQAVLILVGHWFASREPIVTGTIVATLPLSVEALTAPYRVWGFGC
jgi:uncharacterized phiE125 gp8 family phage protein